MSDDHQLLTLADAARLLGLSHTTISVWVRIGAIPSVQMPGSRRKRIRKATLLEFLKKREEDGPEN